MGVVSRAAEALLLAFLLSVTVCFACPKGLHHACQCSEAGSGFDFECRDVNDDLNVVLAPIGKLHVERLTVFGAYWPILKRLPSLSVKAITLVSCGIEEVEDMAFQQVADRLEELVIANNSLSTVPRLGSLKNLLSLNLKFNKISDVPEGSFENMTKLTQLRLDGNKISRFRRNVFNEVKDTLELLDLSDNCLESVPARNIRDSQQLMYLDLSGNKIASIGDFGFNNLPNLKEIRLNNNLVRDIGTLAFKDVPRLKVIFLQNNLLSEFDITSMVEGFRKLEVLDLSNNQLLQVPVLKELPNILQVRLESNKIERVDSYTFSGNPQLQHLSLQDNEIASLSPHCFSRLHRLTHLLLGNNALRFIDRDVFGGMENLEQLSLQNNSLNELENHTFSGIPSLKMLDLSYNGINKISTGAFTALHRLMWIDLSHNVIATIEKGTFVAPIPNIILYGNPILCDDKIDWFVEYLIWNRVRTHLPYQSEVMCVLPEKYATVRLREFLEKKTNDTVSGITSALRMATRGSSGHGFLNLLPAGMRKFLPAGERAESANPYSDVPVIGALTNELPGLRYIPGLSYVPQATGQRVAEVRSLNSAIEKFSSPLIRVVTGESESLADIDQMVQAIPNLAANIPGVGNVDLTQLPPQILLQVLRGGQIPGVEKETLDRILKEHTSKMYEAADAARRGHPLQDEARYLPPLAKLPKEVIAEVMKGGALPYLTKEQMASIKGYYMLRIAEALSKGEADIGLPEGIITPQLKNMIKMLPPNYDIRKIPTEVLESIAQGKIPDIKDLPQDLRDHLTNGGSAEKPGLSAKEVLRNHKTTESPSIPQSEQYDINKVSVDLIKAEEEAKRKQRLRYCSYILLCIVAVVSSIVVVFIVRYMKHRKAMIAERKLDSFCSSEAASHQGPQVATSSRSRSSLTAERSHLNNGSEYRSQGAFGHYSVISPVIRQ